MRSIGIAAMIAAVAGFALFVATLGTSHGMSGVALAVGFGVLFLISMVRRTPLVDVMSPTGAAGSPPDRRSSPAVRAWTVAGIFTLLVLGIFTLRYMYWL